mmetsp:Transcript_31426/g.86414  ORF Transcript_31426/g.86414 Transcript_31426/m.86414 type:complete len:210 (-) Transcript_31426:1967-2596(-)
MTFISSSSLRHRTHLRTPSQSNILSCLAFVLPSTLSAYEAPTLAKFTTTVRRSQLRRSASCTTPPGRGAIVPDLLCLGALLMPSRQTSCDLPVRGTDCCQSSNMDAISSADFGPGFMRPSTLTSCDKGDARTTLTCALNLPPNAFGKMSMSGWLAALKMPISLKLSVLSKKSCVSGPMFDFIWAISLRGEPNNRNVSHSSCVVPLHKKR